MHERETTTMTREVEAVQIPDGSRVIVPEGTRVLITQSLGGSYTVMTERGGMFRIEAENADALGKEVPADAAAAADTETLLEERVWRQMKGCFDPEIPVNIVDLGLVYDCHIEDEGAADGAVVHVKMTLTAPACGMGPVLVEDVKSRIEKLPDVARAEVELVFDPPWSQNMMTEAARLQLGFY
ncbi:MAG: putative Fe-S cluster assembly protein SufT [Thermoanaerobaculia bacterium]